MTKEGALALAGIALLLAFMAWALATIPTVPVTMPLGK